LLFFVAYSQKRKDIFVCSLSTNHVCSRAKCNSFTRSKFDTQMFLFAGYAWTALHPTNSQEGSTSLRQRLEQLPLILLSRCLEFFVSIACLGGPRQPTPGQGAWIDLLFCPGVVTGPWSRLLGSGPGYDSRVKSSRLASALTGPNRPLLPLGASHRKATDSTRAAKCRATARNLRWEAYGTGRIIYK
jgi:hypothetical protein